MILRRLFLALSAILVGHAMATTPCETDGDKSVECFRHWAEQGDETAQYNLLGSPKGLDLSIVTGIIQTDTSVSPGTSGGGLLDSEGNLIGILNSRLPSESAGVSDFAVSVDLALNL